MPSLNRPSLAGRCPLVQDRCSASRPAAEQVEPGHEVHCFRHLEVAEMEQTVDYFARFQDEAERILGAGIEDLPKAPSNVALGLEP